MKVVTSSMNLISEYIKNVKMESGNRFAKIADCANTPIRSQPSQNNSVHADQLRLSQQFHSTS